jgi:hypothetical protein
LNQIGVIKLFSGTSNQGAEKVNRAYLHQVLNGNDALERRYIRVKSYKFIKIEKRERERVGKILLAKLDDEFKKSSGPIKRARKNTLICCAVALVQAKAEGPPPVYLLYKREPSV